MEGERRKREDDDGEITNGKRAKGKEAEQTVTEDEVEEFFAILRRIHVAMKYFEKDNKDGRRKLTDTRWRPCFQAEDFEEHNSVNNDSIIINNNERQEEEEREEENSGLDLNSDPASSKNSY